VLERVTARQPDVAGQLRQIWKSPLIASDPIMWRKDLPQDLKNEIKSFFLAYGHSGPDAVREMALLNKLTLGGFRESRNEQLKPTRQLELFKSKIKVEADASLSADERKVKLEDITRKLSDIAKS
jgi:phosphonate transport system substrate-binding protein